MNLRVLLSAGVIVATVASGAFPQLVDDLRHPGCGGSRVGLPVGPDSAGVWVMDADGSDERRLTEGDRIEVVDQQGARRTVFQDRLRKANPQWSPDGAWIVFDSFPHEDWGWVSAVRPSGTGHRNLTGQLPKPAQHDPVWSPDGSKIAFTDGSGIRVIDADGGRGTCIATGAQSPVWSPDGSHIAFMRSIY